MHGDHSGSPRRDDRQHGDQPGQPLGHAAPPPDIKVAGGSGEAPRPGEQGPAFGEQPAFDGQPPTFGGQAPFGEQPPISEQPSFAEQPAFDGQPPTFGGQAPFAEQAPFGEQPPFTEQPAFDGQPPTFGGQAPFGEQPPFGEQRVGFDEAARSGEQRSFGEQAAFDGQPPMFGEQSAFGGQTSFSEQIPAFGEQRPFEQRPGSGEASQPGEQTAIYGEQPVFEGQPSSFGEQAPGFGGPGSGSDGRAVGSYEQPGRGSRRRLPVKLVAVVAGAAVVVGGGAVAAVAMTGSSGDGKSTVKPGTVAADAERQPDLQAMEAQRRQQNLDRANRAARKDAGKPPALQAKGTPLPTKKPEDGGAPTGGDAVPSGEAQRIARAMLPSFGFDPKTQFSCLVNLWNRESGWRTTAANPSGAYGIPQALPGSKMASAGADWRTSARTQIKWGLGYIKGRYKTPCGAWGHFQSRGWY